MAAGIVVVDPILRVAGRHGSACLATLAAADQVTQQITFAAHVTLTEAKVHLVQSLGTSPNLGIDNPGYGDGNPFRLRTELSQRPVTGRLLWRLGFTRYVRAPVVVGGSGI